MSELGHNGYSFDDVVAENLQRGLYWAQRDCLIRAIRDPNLSHRHRITIAELISAMNSETGMAYPGRRALAEATGYTESGIAKTICELVDMGYVASARRSPEAGGRPLAHYTIVKPSASELRAAIDAHIAAIRAADVTPIGNVTSSSKVTPWGNVTPNRNVTPVGNVYTATLKNIKENQEPHSDVTPVGNVTPVVPTVTSKTLTNITSTTRASGEGGVGGEHKRANRLKADWTIPDTWGRWATDHFDVRPSAVRREADSFRDYWTAKSGKDAAKLDWEATWRNWCRRSFAGKERVSSAGFEDAPSLPLQKSEHDMALEAMQREARERSRALRAARMGDG